MIGKSKALVVGCGYLGARIAGELLLEGKEVYCLSRSGRSVPQGAVCLKGDLEEDDLRTLVPSDLSLVFYTVAAAERSAECYRLSYVLGLERVLEVLRLTSPNVQRVLFSSSTGVYHQTSGEWVDELSPTAPQHFTGRIMLEAEELLLSSGFPAIVVRCSGIYGPARMTLLQRVAAGTVSSSNLQTRYTNRIRVEDCARAMVLLAKLKTPESIYLASDDEPVLYDELLRFLAEKLGVVLPKETQAVSEIGMFGGNKRVSNARLRSTGFDLQYPTYREGYGTQ